MRVLAVVVLALLVPHLVAQAAEHVQVLRRPLHLLYIAQFSADTSDTSLLYHLHPLLPHVQHGGVGVQHL